MFLGKIQEMLMLLSAADKETIRFSDTSSKVIIRGPFSSLPSIEWGEKLSMYLHYYYHARDKKEHRLFTIALNFQDEENPVIDKVDLDKLPVLILRGKSPNLEHALLDTKRVVSSLPIVDIDHIDEDNLSFKFMDAYQNPFEVIEEKMEKSPYAGERSIGEANLYWNINKYDLSPLPRIQPGVAYIEEDESFLVFEGYVPAKYLPDDYVSFCCKQILKERAELNSKAALALAQKSYFPIDDFWKFHVRESRWELISLLSYLTEPPDSWVKRHRSIPGHDIKSCHFICARHHKVYLVFRDTKTRKGWISEFDYTRNKFRQLGEVEIDFHNQQNGSPPLFDESNNTLIYFPDKLDKLLVVCLETLKITEIHLNTDLPPLYEETKRDRGFIDSGNKLVIVVLSKCLLQNEGESIRFTYLYSIVDWGRVKRRKITPFLKQVRAKGNSSYQSYFKSIIN